MARWIIAPLVLLLVAALATGTVAAEKVNLYSSRKEALIKPLLDQFTDKTGIKANLVTGNEDALLKRLQSEGRNSPADVLLTSDAGRLHRAKAAGLLQPVDSARLKAAVPGSYRDPEGFWYGLSLRARPVLYVKDRVSPAELSTYEALADPHWKGRICIRSSDNIYNQSLVASMIASLGEAETEAWARGLVANMARPPRGGDRDQIKAAAVGQCDLAIANTYYLGMMLDSRERRERALAQKVAVFWPNQNDRGTHVNVSGAGITRSAKHVQNAIQLLEFLASDTAQAWYAEINHEYPVKPRLKVNPTLASWGDFKKDVVNLSLLGTYNAAAVKLMDRAGWK